MVLSAIIKEGGFGFEGVLLCEVPQRNRDMDVSYGRVVSEWIRDDMASSRHDGVEGAGGARVAGGCLKMMHG